MSKLIGITGGIGSGKSTIARYILSKGYPVYFSDIEAKRIMESEDIQKKIIDFFGQQVLEESKISRVKLAKIVFESDESLHTLNQIIHPAVAQDFKNWRNIHSKSNLIFKEAAILFESGSYKDCDKIITITAPRDIRINRVINRDGIGESEVIKRMNHQWDEEKKIANSDYVIINLDLQMAYQKADEILKELEILQ